jgi:DNA-binding transcriptional MocR family regulator
MTADRADDVRRARARRRRVSAGVLADRMAAALVQHEPGWRLPRLTAMARRFNVSAAEIDAAIDELAARHLLRRLPDGQVYRASPAEYRVPLEGLRPDLFRIVIQAAAGPDGRPGGFASVWTHAAAGWEP